MIGAPGLVIGGWPGQRQTMAILKDLKKYASRERAKTNAWFFKTGKGEYGEGDLFLGVKAADQRKIAKAHQEAPLQEIKKSLDSKYHEERLTSLYTLVYKYKSVKDDEKAQKKIYQFYTKNFRQINNWDLVDCSAPYIVGGYLLERDRSVLYKWARSKSLWTRRISIVTCWWFIRENDLQDVFKLSVILLNDKEDLVHKAVGWMLREAGKKDGQRLDRFLRKHYKKMPRTMLRYSIEKFPEAKRKKILAGTWK